MNWKAFDSEKEVIKPKSVLNPESDDEPSLEDKKVPLALVERSRNEPIKIENNEFTFNAFNAEKPSL